MYALDLNAGQPPLNYVCTPDSALLSGWRTVLVHYSIMVNPYLAAVSPPLRKALQRRRKGGDDANSNALRMVPSQARLARV